MIFYHVFLNDLADTMREAVSYYRTECFHREVITGLKNIADKIDLLSIEMRDVRREIHTMNDNAINLANEAEKISKSISVSIDLQRQSIQETQATRYAIESLHQSVERYNYYRAH